MKKVAIYCRLSDEDRNKKSSTDDSESIQNQKNLLMKHALDKGWDIYKIYSDDDYSGLDSDRPEFNEMIKDGENRKFNIILCKTQSRFTRDMELVEKYLHNKFLDWGIRFVTMVDGVDTQDKHNKKSRQINGLVNEWYCEDVSESIKAIFRMKQQSGKFIGSFACYGYMKDPNDRNRIIIDEEAAENVRLIFDLYLKGHGTQSIAHILNERGILNPTKYKQVKGLKYINSSANDDYGLWNRTTVKRILKSETYIGNLEQHKRAKVNYKSKKVKCLNKRDWIVAESTHEPIVDREVFDIVQRRMNSNIRSTGIGTSHILAGKVRCMDCNSNMHKISNGEGYQYLRCKLYCNTPKNPMCTSHSIRLGDLEQFVEGKLRDKIESFNEGSGNSQDLLSEYTAKKKNVESEIEKVDENIETCSLALKNLYLDKIKGLISQDQFNELNNTFLAEKEKLIEEKEQLAIKLSNVSSKSGNSKLNIVIKKYQGFCKLNHSMVEELIDYIEVGEKNKKDKEREIKIHWNF